MIKVALSSKEERTAIFLSTGKKIKIDAYIVEKDFWVTYTLDYLFNRCKYKDSFVFKGGTSLSKAYNVIDRFSEDIDIILDWNTIDYTTEELWEERSRTKQDKLNKKVVSDASKFLENDLLPLMIKDLSKELNTKVKLEMDNTDKDRCTINFYYPNIYDNTYIKPFVRLEIGPLAQTVPSHLVEIIPYIKEAYENEFKDVKTMIKTTDIERTFWEKILILNSVANGYRNDNLPHRYSRHYYDVFKIANSKYISSCLKNKELYEKDIEFNKKFYYSANANYENAGLHNIKLIPNEDMIKKLEKDYNLMKNMFFRKYPSFDEIVNKLKEIEKEINEL